MFGQIIMAFFFKKKIILSTVLLKGRELSLYCWKYSMIKFRILTNWFCILSYGSCCPSFSLLIVFRSRSRPWPQRLMVYTCRSWPWSGWIAAWNIIFLWEEEKQNKSKGELFAYVLKRQTYRMDVLFIHFLKVFLFAPSKNVEKKCWKKSAKNVEKM